jgi:hypothetical protein
VRHRACSHCVPDQQRVRWIRVRACGVAHVSGAAPSFVGDQDRPGQRGGFRLGSQPVRPGGGKGEGCARRSRCPVSGSWRRRGTRGDRRALRFLPGCCRF